jgi:ABC-type uncharacterized transport system fused permease/ATPase subunit
MRPFVEIALIRDQRQLLARFWQSASQFWREKRAGVVALAAFLVGIVLLQLLLQVLINLWNRNFFDALERRDAAAIWAQAELFVVLAAASIVLAATSVWGRMTAQRSWREALTGSATSTTISPKVRRPRGRRTRNTASRSISASPPTRRSTSRSRFCPRC